MNTTSSEIVKDFIRRVRTRTWCLILDEHVRFAHPLFAFFFIFSHNIFQIKLQNKDFYKVISLSWNLKSFPEWISIHNWKVKSIKRLVWWLKWWAFPNSTLCIWVYTTNPLDDDMRVDHSDVTVSARKWP